ncbi:hypothetical protein AJ78_04139 [Emergomyces pasteurianus Ep9510]|uniref:Uncharacterized protein n=1 Tax=Emergomyces pasteurianus Ep9510 TaxID=1447872 RepID=A0A1J9Q5X0_9EURO|nr:hypothetical protein AJ78_04139 [Emergomyces pasteurianus Ep9510]
MFGNKGKEYTVGWICAILPELVAAQSFLDEEYTDVIDAAPNDDNCYTLGRIGEHNVVIACLPDGEYGEASAASIAKDMHRSFPHIRIGLMVGVGGGAPSEKHDIRLGDVVISTPCGNYGGVFQYDFGKTIQGRSFQTTGFLNKPPSFLLTAVNSLKAKYKSGGHQLESAINNILEKKPRLGKEYKRPDASTDRLYNSHYIHSSNNKASGAATCAEICDTCQLIQRLERLEEDDNLAIHYGLIASADQLMKDALVRDELSAQKHVLCFEMEAAGLMNTFPCIVIRGICDYSDSHKNKEWQGYAAMAAAAYAKDLLCTIHPRRVEAEKKISDILHGLKEIAGEHRDIARKQLELQQEAAEQALSDKQRACLQLFRLTKSTGDATYEWYKDRIEDRVEGTCEWFLRHNHFQKWLKQESGPLLVSADPGCGKSVLAKYLVDHKLPGPATICYFFFKDQDQNTVRQALCALLHQLFSQKPSLIQHAMTPFAENGPGLINSTSSLWTILGDATRDPDAGPVILVLDALDECDEVELKNLVWNLEVQFRGNQLNSRKLKYLLTSRPYEQIVSKFWRLLDAFPKIRIPGEEESETISEEVNLVIQYRVEQLAIEKKLSDRVRSHLEARLLEIQHRTYLWVYLVFDYLREENFKKTPNGVDSIINTLPKNINQAYEQILNKSKKLSTVRMALGIVLAAKRPLILSEMNVAMNTENTPGSICNLDLEEEEDFKMSLRSWCGLFISIYQGKVYFLHQTAREFLLAPLLPSAAILTELHWHHSITIHDAHRTLAKTCVRYLNLFNSEASFLADTTAEASLHPGRLAFLDYSAKFWSFHYREARISNYDASITSLAWGISDPDSRAYSVWSEIYCDALEDSIRKLPENPTALMVASYFGHSDVAQLLMDQNIDLESKDEDGRTSLSWAVMTGHEAVAKLLLEAGANPESKDGRGWTPLSHAVSAKDGSLIKLLLEKGADLESKDLYGWTPLIWATGGDEYNPIVKILLEKGANPESKGKDGRTFLSWAVTAGNETVVKLLLEKNYNLESKDNNGMTPLLEAARNGNETVVKLLLEKSVNIESKNEDGWTALLETARNGHQAVVKLLLEKGANLESKDKDGMTPLSYAASRGHDTVIELLLEKGANLEPKDKDGMTPLLYAASRGHGTVIEMLLETGANLESKDKDGMTPLSWAASRGYKTVSELLLEKGANLESKDEYGRTPLIYAARKGHERVVRLLLEKCSNLKSKDEDGMTPLSWAVRRGHKAVVKLLLEKNTELSQIEF